MENYPPPNLRPILDYYCETASKIFGVDIDDETRARWCDIIHLTRIIDDEIDSGTFEMTDASSQYLCDYYLSEEYLSRHFPTLLPELDQERYEELCSLAKKIFTINRFTASTKNPKEYTAFRKTEGTLYAQMILCCCSKELRASRQFDDFARNFTLLGEMGILFDSIVDNKNDHERNAIKVRYSLSDKIAVTALAASMGKSLDWKSILKPSALKVLGGATCRVIASSMKQPTAPY